MLAIQSAQCLSAFLQLWPRLRTVPKDSSQVRYTKIKPQPEYQDWWWSSKSQIKFSHKAITVVRSDKMGANSCRYYSRKFVFLPKVFIIFFLRASDLAISVPKLVFINIKICSFCSWIWPDLSYYFELFYFDAFFKSIWRYYMKELLDFLFTCWIGPFLSKP